jgi:uncharacterized protein DUF3999
MKATLLLFVLATVAAQEKPSEHPYAAPIALDPGASHYRFTVPPAVYRGASRRDLGDLRVFNGSAEPVPYAFAPRETRPPAPALQTLNLFPLYGDREKGIGATSVRVERTQQGTVVNVSVADAVPPTRRRLLGYLLDASELKAPQEALLLAWQAREGFSGSARVEGSEDLKSWNSLAANAPLLFLEHAGARLERNRVELSGARARYLRISFDGVAPDFQLKEVRVELRAQKAEPAREWVSLRAAPGKLPGELVVDTQGHFPVDRLRLSLPQANTVAQLELSTRERPEEPWRHAGSATAYRLARNGGELTNPDVQVAVNPDRYWRILVDQKGGGFGAGEVTLELGWLPHEVLFAARGAGPFTLAYGNKLAKAGAAPLPAVLPQDEKLAAALARVGEATGSAPPSVSLFSDPVRFISGLSENREIKKWTLWVVLLGGVLLLGWMAHRLLRDMGKAPPGPKNS